MEAFEWDEVKAESNLRKHGVDFDDAKNIFSRPYIAREDSRCDYGETRYVAIGSVFGRVLVVVYTMRGETCRLISARRAKRREERDYYSTVCKGEP